MEKMDYKSMLQELLGQIKDERFLRMLWIMVNDYLAEKAI